MILKRILEELQFLNRNLNTVILNQDILYGLLKSWVDRNKDKQ